MWHHSCRENPAMKKVVVCICIGLSLLVSNKEARADASHLLKLQRALQDVLISSRHADDLAQSIFRFLVKSNPDDTLEALEASLKADILLHTSRERSEKLIQSLKIVYQYDTEAVGTCLRNMGSTLKKMLGHDFMFPKLMELGGFSRMEVNMMFQASLGRNPTINLIRLKELGLQSAPDFINGFSGDLFFQIQRYRVTLNPPIAGLLRESYKGIQVVDEAGNIIKKIPLEDARNIQGFTERIDDLMARASQEITETRQALRTELTSTASEFTAKLARDAKDLAAMPNKVPRIAINKETLSLAGKRMNKVTVKIRDGSEMTVRLEYNAQTLRFDFDRVVITQNVDGENIETLMHWTELQAFLNDEHTLGLIKDYLVSQRATRVFRREP